MYLPQMTAVLYQSSPTRGYDFVDRAHLYAQRQAGVNFEIVASRWAAFL